MKPTLKLILLFLTAACILVAINGYLEVIYRVDHTRNWMIRVHQAVATLIEQSDNPVGWETLELRALGTRVRAVDFSSEAFEPSAPLASPDVVRSLEPGEMVSVIVSAADGQDYFCSYYLTGRGRGVQVLEVSEPLAGLDQQSGSQVIRTLGMIAALIAVAIVLILISGMTLIGRQRLEALIEKTRQAAEGDLATPVRIGGQDELTELADALNQMCVRLEETQQEVVHETAQRLDAMQQLRHADRLKTVGRLASGVAHELGTPLNVVAGRAGLIAGGRLSTEQMTDSARTIQSETSRMTQIVQQLLNFARRSTPRRTSCNLRMLVDDTLRLLEPLARRRQATVSVSPDSPAEICGHADCGQLQQVISNLVMNAILSRERDAEVVVSLAHEHAGNPDIPGSETRDCVRLTVTDNGTGIDEDTLPHLFEPFFTTRDVGEGTGLGLSIAHGIITEHQGWITVDSVPGQGSSFHVFLPVTTDADESDPDLADSESKEQS